MTEEIICTQIYLVKGGQVCLPLKKRGFGAGWHNGYGGKVKLGEDLESSAKRELLEESGVKALRMEKRAILHFKFLHSGKKIVSHLYFCNQFENEPIETEEMKPFWFLFDNIPYDKMWPDDIHWMLRFLSGEKFEGVFNFSDDKPTIRDFDIWNLERLD